MEEKLKTYEIHDRDMSAILGVLCEKIDMLKERKENTEISEYLTKQLTTLHDTLARKFFSDEMMMSAECQHGSQCTIPQTDESGKYVEPEYTVCIRCGKIIPIGMNKN